MLSPFNSKSSRSVPSTERRTGSQRVHRRLLIQQTNGKCLLSSATLNGKCLLHLRQWVEKSSSQGSIVWKGQESILPHFLLKPRTTVFKMLRHPSPQLTPVLKKHQNIWILYLLFTDSYLRRLWDFRLQARNDWMPTLLMQKASIRLQWTHHFPNYMPNIV